MSATDLARDAAKKVNRHTPMALAIIGSIGIAATAWTSYKAGVKATRRIVHEEMTNEKYEEESMTPREQIDLTWKYYLVPLSIGIATVVCVVSSSVISQKRQTAIIGAYALGERAFSQYKDKVIETLGLEDEKDIVEKVAEDNAKEDAAKVYSKNDVPEINGNKALFIDHLSGQEFIAELEDVYLAKEAVNLRAAEEGYASMNYFYSLVGGRRTELYENIGWNTDRMMELIVTRVKHDNEDVMPIYGLDFYEQPLLEHQRVI